MESELVPLGKLPWSVRRRLEFIDFRLAWYGRINRGDLRNRFNISPQQATTDIERYLSYAPGNMRYDPPRRTFVRTDEFKRLLTEGQADRYLLQLQALKTHVIGPDQTWFDELPPLEVVSLPRKPMSDEVLAMINQAIREGRQVKITYSTMSGKPESDRLIVPHSFAYGHDRWHVRAWNEGHNDFRDFNLGRISSIQLLDKLVIDAKLDFEWQTYGRMEIKANPNLTSEEQATIRREYSFPDEESLIVPCRLALLIYIKHQYGLEDVELEASRRPLILENSLELEEFRKAARRMSVAALNPLSDSR